MNEGTAMLFMAAAAAVLAPDCRDCNHPLGYHIPRDIFTGRQLCRRRLGWRRRRCPCGGYQ